MFANYPANPIQLVDNNWKYLSTEAFQSRYAVAAWALRDCDHIFEIGGYKTPISDFVKGKYVTVVDPLMDEKHHGLVRHCKINFEDCVTYFRTSYGVVILGMELHLNDWQKVYDLLNGAKRVVIEVPIQHQPSVDQFRWILANTNKKVTFQVLMDMTGNQFEEGGAPPMCLRKILVLD